MLSVFNIKKQAGYFSANFLIKGNVTKEGVPISCLVREKKKKTGVLLSSTISKADGSYVLFGGRTDQNYVTAIDPDNEFNIATQDNVS